MNLSDFDFALPADLVAQFPTTKRSESRLLVLDKISGKITHKHFKDLPDFLLPRDLLVFNNTKVIPARLFATKVSGGKVEILVERILDDKKILAQTKASKTLRPGTKLFLSNEIYFEVAGRQHDFFELLLSAPCSINEVLEQFGFIPLPPYIKHQPTITDKNRYQTIYAKHNGAVAAPTAGLHFDEELMQKLDEKNIQKSFLTLHVGAGTFQSIRTEEIKDHKMHAEYIEITPALCEQIAATKKLGNKVIAVGTTSVRALETASQTGELNPYSGDTNIFIYPGYKFHSVDALITNFHLPKTTLLMLVSAFAGYENIMNAYQEAIRQKYRFFSYGDAMLII